MQEVCQDIFHVKIPLMHSPLKELNCYMVRGSDRNLIIDTGFNQAEARAVLLGAVKELNFTPDNTDIFITHLHSDHSGLTCALKTEKNKAFMGKVDGDLCNGLLSDGYWAKVDEKNVLMGFPSAEMLDHTNHPAYAYRLEKPMPFTHIEEGDELSVGRYRFKVVDFAGHTPGQMGLYEEKEKICFCADHLLAKITPNIIAWDLDHDYLGIFLKNLQKIKGMEITRLFGGHRAFIENHRTRVDELFAHHEKRLGEVLNALTTGPKTVYETAGIMQWEFAGGSFKDFPAQQKWFAASEAFAHLQHLLFQGKIQRVREGSSFFFFL